MSSSEERREALKASYHAARTCSRCPQLAATRTQVVFGSGNADADLMFVGEAPGREEDEQGLPFVGRSGRLLDQLLTEIGLAREDVFIANTLMCRPPQNRDPAPSELTNCESYLWEKLELIRPIVVCTLGNFATKLLRGDTTAITKIHGQPEVRTLGPRAVRLLPLFHPAAALYQRANVELLRADFAQIPGLLARGAPPQPVVAEAPDEELVEPEHVAQVVADAQSPAADDEEVPAAAPPEPPPADQLGLF